jgi:hypothetical protein
VPLFQEKLLPGTAQLQAPPGIKSPDGVPPAQSIRYFDEYQITKMQTFANPPVVMAIPGGTTSQRKQWVMPRPGLFANFAGYLCDLCG